MVALPRHLPRVPSIPEALELDPLVALWLEAFLDAPLPAGESQRLGAARREQAIASLLVRLPRAQARALVARLRAPPRADALAPKFAKLPSRRRARLLALLGDGARDQARCRGLDQVIGP